MDKITAVVSVYNVDKYIKRALDTIINQTYKNLEIILVNDGSTDTSGEICNQYASKDNRIRVINKLNAGLSSARNIGILNATGKYITFPDPDDWLALDMYEKLHKAIKQNDVNIAVCDIFFSDDTSNKTIAPSKELKENTKLNYIDILDYMCDRDSYGNAFTYMHNKLIELSVITKNKVLFDEDARRGEDRLFWTTLLLKDNTITATYINEAMYYYYKRPGALTQLTDNITISSMFTTLDKVINMLETHNCASHANYIKALKLKRQVEYSNISTEGK